MLHDQLGDWFEWQRRESMRWLYVMAACIMIMLVITFFVKPKTPDYASVNDISSDILSQTSVQQDDDISFWTRELALYPLEYVPGFWCMFGLAGYFVLVLVLRKCLQPLLFRGTEAGRD